MRTLRRWVNYFRQSGEAGLVEEFRALWLDTVRRHLLADVPLGVFLSGGVDSSAVAAAMARLSDRPVRAFSIGFPGTAVDETEHARRTARHLACFRRCS